MRGKGLCFVSSPLSPLAEASARVCWAALPSIATPITQGLRLCGTLTIHLLQMHLGLFELLHHLVPLGTDGDKEDY